VIGIALGLEIDDQRRSADGPQRRGREERALEAMRRPLLQHAARRPRRRGEVIRKLVEEPLDPKGRLQRPERAQLGRAEFLHPHILARADDERASGPRAGADLASSGPSQ